MTSEKINVVVNGEPREFAAGQSINELLSGLGLHPRLIVVEYNREILERGEYEHTQVRDGDALELVHFVGGG